ncbi:MAG: hypothetical protein QW791_09310 [Candidatus Bathyarchaeia archaeon]
MSDSKLNGKLEGIVYLPSKNSHNHDIAITLKGKGKWLFGSPHFSCRKS